MSQPLHAPREGIPAPLTTPEDVAAAANTLANGSGPFAIDTERAAGYRYTDRAFLIQIRRRGAGTFLIDPEPQRHAAVTPEAITAPLKTVLNDSVWIIHAASTDLPCLAELGLHPGELFDTELAARLAGFDHPNLANMVELLLGYQLAKGHGGEDWSRRPLPADWLSYAALDVELLIELADVLYDILAEQDKLAIARQEFDHIRIENRPGSTSLYPTDDDWRRLKGLGALRTPEQLAVARSLWQRRNTLAARRDLAPGRILPNSAIIAVARNLPATMGEVSALRGVPRDRRRLQKLFDATNLARTSNPQQWPERERGDAMPNHRNWKDTWPEAAGILATSNELLRAQADAIGIPTENLLKPKIVRVAAWASAYGHAETGFIPDSLPKMRQLLLREGARDWQADIAAPLLFFGAAGDITAANLEKDDDNQPSSEAES
ncbi:HRDC domain-containing protein [Corynebacterium ulceribovis]|uniref:HRDC domain-containing protein n=1 Tax=Corynebacterium ulceribovis TaxID=487732 RepID=UPI0003781CC0|nr:HRDC domain-containing protein [Corynebacterium ulceribovis]